MEGTVEGFSNNQNVGTPRIFSIFLIEKTNPLTFLRENSRLLRIQLRAAKRLSHETMF